MDKDFTYNLYVSTFNAGFGQMLRLSDILKFQQEAGEQQLEQYDLGYAELIKRNLAFVVTNVSSVINRMPVYGEKIRLVTWNRGIKGAKFYRCYNWYDEQDKLIIEGCTCFALVDFAKHVLQRPSVLGGIIPEYFDRSNSAGDPKKINIPQENMADAGQKMVMYSELDGNGHLNNAYYADFIVNYICGSMQGKRVTSFNIDYIKEAREDDVISVKTFDDNGDVYYEGAHERGICFCAKCKYVKE